jgi:DNA sulfur modification protein DndD
MLLLKLKLFNFRQFYADTTEIEFSTDATKNITLIHGENGIGKTTILNAILWCLYEKLTDDFEQKQELISLQSVKEGGKSCRVELHFQYENKHYLAQRNLQNTLQPSFKLFEITNNNHDEVPNPKSFVNSILPDEMAEYFFFHGEGVSNINSTKSGDKFRRAIRDILGFRLAETAVEDLKDINKKWTKELSNLQNLSQEQSDLIKSKMSNELKAEKLEKESLTLNTEKEMYQRDLEDVLERLRTCSHKDAEELQRQVDILTRRNREVDYKIINSKIEKQGLIKKYGWIIFGQKLANQALDFIDEQSLKAKLPAPYDESLVNDLIERESCICGRDLKIGTDEYSKVLNLIEKADNAGIRHKLMKARTAGGNIKNRFKDFLSELEKVENRLAELDCEKRDTQTELIDKNKALKEIDIDVVKELERLKDACNRKLEKCNQEIGSKSRNIETIERDLQGIEVKLKKFGADDKRISLLTSHQTFAADLIKLCELKLDQYEKDSKRTITSKVNSTLQEFSRKDFRVKVGEDFSFFLVRDDGMRVAKSKGENLLLNLSFVSALIDFAQLRSGASGEFLVSGTTAPFVIDAPFGELDNTYKRATAQFLPQRSRQLIFLLSSSHWSGAVDETIRDKVGSEYVLISSKTSTQSGRPDDKIVIEGKEYIQSLYNQDKDATFIERVR